MLVVNGICVYLYIEQNIENYKEENHLASVELSIL